MLTEEERARMLGMLEEELRGPHLPEDVNIGNTIALLLRDLYERQPATTTTREERPMSDNTPIHCIATAFAKGTDPTFRRADKQAQVFTQGNALVVCTGVEGPADKQSAMAVYLSDGEKARLAGQLLAELKVITLREILGPQAFATLDAIEALGRNL